MEKIEFVNKLQFAPGWYPDIKNDDYHAANGLSATSVKKLLSMNGEHIAHELANPTAPQRDRIIGSACHSLLLQPTVFDSEFLVHEPFDLRKSKDRDQLFEMRAYNPHRQLLPTDDYDIAKKMAARAMAHRTAGAYLEDFVGESSVFQPIRVFDEVAEAFREPLMKCRPDALPVLMPVIVDIKTTMDASLSGFANQIRKLHYDLAAFHYLKVCNESQPLLAELEFERFEQFVFIAIENFAPYCVACYDLSAAMLAEGGRKWGIAVDRWLDGALTGGYPNDVRTIDTNHAFNKENV